MGTVRNGRDDGPGRPSRPKKAASPKIYFLAAGALGLVVILLLVVALVAGGGEEKKAAPRRETGPRMGVPAESGPSPASYSSSPSTSAYASIERRSADSAPLTAAEAFPESAESISASEAKVALKGKRLDGDCAAAIWGRGLGAELRSGGCSQAARTIHVDAKKGYALSVTVFNLAGAREAGRVVEALERRRGGGFVTPLTAEGADGFGRGFGMARGLAMGHYAVVAWAQRLDGKGDEKDETLLSLLIEGGKAPAVLGRAARNS
ncbi:hypothetical protein [Spirillospora sp. CA-294931]|uniref:hypothetical protein n=1 Tax=Spirillospora sp. CA-294931 TaxID=3240042 RepID=UPI003D921852